MPESRPIVCQAAVQHLAELRLGLGQTALVVVHLTQPAPGVECLLRLRPQGPLADLDRPAVVPFGEGVLAQVGVGHRQLVPHSPRRGLPGRLPASRSAPAGAARREARVSPSKPARPRPLFPGSVHTVSARAMIGFASVSASHSFRRCSAAASRSRSSRSLSAVRRASSASSRSARTARARPATVPTSPTVSTSPTAAAAATGPLFRRTNFRSR